MANAADRPRAGTTAGPRRPGADELAAARAKANAEAGAAAGATEPLADGLPPEGRRLLDAEADAIASEFASDAPPLEDGGNEGQLSPEAIEQGYLILANMVVSQGAAIAIPNWHITGPETDDMSKALVECLMLWFPDGVLPPKYLSILAIAGVAARIAMVRRDPQTGALPPRHAPPPRPPPPPPGAQHIQV